MMFKCGYYCVYNGFYDNYPGYYGSYHGYIMIITMVIMVVTWWYKINVTREWILEYSLDWELIVKLCPEQTSLKSLCRRSWMKRRNNNC